MPFTPADPDLHFDDTLFPIQPTDAWVDPPEGDERETLSGGVEGSARPKGHVVRLRWGRDAAPYEVAAALRAARGGTLLHKVKVTDPSGFTFEGWVIWRQDIPWSVQLWRAYRPIEIRLREAA